MRPRENQDMLKMRKILEGNFRPNLYLEAFPKTSKLLDDLALANIAKQVNGKWRIEGSTIIYCPTRKVSADACDRLNAVGLNCELYHAGLTPSQRKNSHTRFSTDKCKVGNFLFFFFDEFCCFFQDNRCNSRFRNGN